MGMFDWLNPQPDAEEQERAKRRQRAAEQRARDIERQRNAAAHVSVVDQAIAGAPMVTAAQGNHLTKMAEDVTEAIEKENDSRVSQLREMRRMEHEKELEAMRTSALIERVRIAKEADERSKSAPFGGLLIDYTGTARQID